MQNKKLLTTAIAYANAAPHIGHAFEFVVADTLARFNKMTNDTFFITGMDEHGQKIEQKAKEEGILPEDYVTKYATLFKDLDSEMSVAYDYFVRTSDKEKHYVGATYLWNQLIESSDLEKRSYKALYCVGCEEFKSDKDLNENGECPAHLKKPEEVEEENYFFKLSRYTSIIKEKIQTGEMDVIPVSRKNEILALLERGLDDVSFSRPKSKVSWGIPVPGDDSQVMYVWCDALSNYITALDYGKDTFDEERWKNTTHIIGKDILRFHAAIWPGMLLSAGLSLPKKIIVHGHITSGGQKMSKSLGNVINPREIIDLFKTVSPELSGEALRFVLLYKVPTFEDGDVTIDSIKEAYTAHLQNGIGNLTNRIMKLAESYLSNPVNISNLEYLSSFEERHLNALNDSNTKHFLEELCKDIGAIDTTIATTEPFKVVKVDREKGEALIKDLVINLAKLAYKLTVVMPRTSEKMLNAIKANKMPESPLFGRLV